MKLRLWLATVLTMVLVSPALAERPGDFPQWRGPNRDGHSPATGLLGAWPEGGPPVVWQSENLGEAYSTVAVADGRIYTQGNVESESRIICLDEATGEVIWSVHPPSDVGEYTHGKGNGARGTPTVDGNYVYAETGGGAVACLEAETGEIVWEKHLVKDLGGRRPGWGFSESPLVDGPRLIVTPGGRDGCVAALDKLTGATVWRSTDVDDRAHYCSAITVELAGVHQVLQFTRSRVVGLDAETGKLLWDYANSANRTANVATPIVRGNLVFSSSAYGTGGGLVRVTREGDEFQAEEVYFARPMANHHGGIVRVGDYMYGFGSGGLICMHFETGEIAWRNRSVGKGSLCYADGYLYCLGQGNKMALVEANSEEYVETGRFDLPEGEYPTWAHPVVANGRLYLRDQNVLTSYDVRASSRVGDD